MDDLALIPHSIRRAAWGHARLSHAGGSWGLSQPALIADPKRVRCFNRKLAAFNRYNRKKALGGEHAKHNRHIPADLLDVVIDRAVIIIIQGVPMSRSISMHMRADMAVRATFTMGVLKREAMVIVTDISSGGP